MKHKLKERLSELGYALSYIDDKLEEWDMFLEEVKPWEFKSDDILIEKYHGPTEEIPKFFLNVDCLYESVLLFDGDVHSIYKENTLKDKIQFADYLVCNNLCLLRTNRK